MVKFKKYGVRHMMIYNILVQPLKNCVCECVHIVKITKNI